MTPTADRKKRTCKPRLALAALAAAMACLMPGPASGATGPSGFSVAPGGVHAGSANLVTNWAVVPADTAGRQPVIDLLCLSSSSNSAALAFWEPVASATVALVNTNHGWSNLVTTTTNGGWAVGDRVVFWSRTNSTWQTMICRGASTNAVTPGGTVTWTNVIQVDTNGASGGFLATPRAGDVVYRMSRILELDLTADGSAIRPTNALGGLQTFIVVNSAPLYYGKAGQPLMLTLRGGQIGNAAVGSTNRIWVTSGRYQ